MLVRGCVRACVSEREGGGETFKGSEGRGERWETAGGAAAAGDERRREDKAIFATLPSEVGCGKP